MKNVRLNYVSFDSTRWHGQMNTNKAFYPANLSPAERKAIMQLNKDAIANEVGIDYKRIFIPIQKNMNNPDKYEDGKCYTLTSEDLEVYSDLYDYDVDADIVKLTPETPYTAIAFPVADCAVVKAVNIKTNEAVLSHCGGEYIDRYLPMQTIDALGGDEKDIIVYVSAFAHELFYKNAADLKWANNRQSVWANCLTEYENNENTSIRVNVYKALKTQLRERCISEENIIFSPYDINKTDLFYSNSRQHKCKKYAGRFLSGIALCEDHFQDRGKPYINVIRK